MSIFTSKKLKSPAINLKDDEKQNTITQHADQANYNTIITQENLQTGSYLNSQREFLIKDKQHTQNILSQKKDSQVNNQGIYFQEQNSNQNNDYENIYLTNKEDQQKQILKSNDIFEKRSSRFDINIHSDQIEIIDGNDNSVVSPQTTQRKYQKTENEIIDIDEQGQKENLNNQIVNNNDKYHKEKAAQIGLVYKAQLKNDDSPSQIKRKSDQKSEKSILSNQQSLKNYANNGQKLWSIVKKDIFYPIKFNGKLAFGLSNQPYQIIDILIDFVFLIDMFFSCITGINEGGEIIKDRYYITKKYLRVSSLILICVHVMTCWWIEIGQLEQLGETADLPQEFKQVGWVNNYYLKYPNKPQYGSYNQDIYITGYYFVTTTIATVGYGDLASKTVMEEFYTMFCEFFGIALFGYISGGLISAVQISLLVGTQKRNEMKSEFDQWLFQREKNRETPLYFQLLKNLRDINNFNTEKNFSNFFNHQEYFHYLPKEQKRKIFNLIFTDIATFFGAFFRNINELSMIQDLFQYMHPLSQFIFRNKFYIIVFFNRFLPGAEIIKYRSLPRGLYLLVSGKVHIGTGKKINSMLVNNNLKAGQKNKNKVKHIERQYFRKLYPGSFFGEFSLLEKNSSFNFVAGGKQIVNVLYISKAKFIETCSKYKESNQWLKQFSYYRFKYFKMVIQFFTKYDLKSIKIIQKEKYAYLKKVNFQMKNNQKRPNQNEKAGFSRFSKLKQIFNNKKEELENNFVEDEVNNEDSESDDQEKYIYSQRDTTKKIEPINESKELDFSSSSDISSKENQKIIKETFEQSEQNQQTDKASSKQNILHAKKQSLLDEMQLKEDEPLPRISQVFNPQDHKRGVKSDLSLYLQNSKKGEQIQQK